MQIFYKICLFVGFFILIGKVTLSQVVSKIQPNQNLSTWDTGLYFTRDNSSTVIISAEDALIDITLRELLSLALLNSPELKVFHYEVRSQEASQIVANLRPNPEIGIDVENIGKFGSAQAMGTAESSIKLSQIIELGGKRKRRQHYASLNHKLAKWSYQTKRIAVLTNITKLFVDLLAAQEKLALTKQSVTLSAQVYSAVSERVNAGKVTPTQEIRARATLSLAQIELNSANRKLISSRQSLHYALGDKSVSSFWAVGDLKEIDSIPPPDLLIESISQSPEIARWADEVAQRQAALKMERSKRIPDLSLGGGIQRFNDSDQNAFMINLAIPLPIFNRNQGNLLEAHNQVGKVEEERRAAELKVMSQLMSAYESLSSAYMETMVLEHEVLPAVQKTFEAVVQGYDQGKYDYLNVLDAQRALINTKNQYLSSLTSYHKSVAEVEGIIGQSLANFNKSLNE